MSYFAKLNNNNKVIGVEVVNDACISNSDGTVDEQQGIDFLTKLNNGVGWYRRTFEDGRRKNLAGIGFTFSLTRDAFIAPQPFPSWTLNEDTCQYDSPVPYPTDDKMYEWDEPTTNWKEVI